MSENDDALIVTAGKVEVRIDKATGYLSGYSVSGKEMLRQSFAPNFWRAETDNDWRGWKPSHYLAYWKDADERMEGQTSLTVSSEDAEVMVKAVKAIDKAVLSLTYTVYPSGAVTVSYDIKMSDDVLEPLRIGLQGQIAGEYDNITYFGRGPQENYSDRNDGIFLGTWTTSVEDMMTQYVYPQENGNRTDVQWISLTDDKGRGLLVKGDCPLSVSVWNTTQDELNKAAHIGEAVLLEDASVLNVDLVQTGVGGTDSWSQRARPYDQYRLLEKRYAYSFTISPLR